MNSHKCCNDTVLIRYTPVDVYKPYEIKPPATPGSVGFDIRFYFDSGAETTKGDLVIAHSNLAFELPEGYYLEILPRSSTYKQHKLTFMLVNSIGIIDTDYRGEVKAVLKATKSLVVDNKINGDYKDLYGKGSITLQGIIKKAISYTLQPVPYIDKETERGEGGFGSTDKKGQ